MIGGEGHGPACCRRVAERSPLPTALTDGPGHVVRWANPAFLAMAGASGEDFLGRPFPEIGACRSLLDRVRRTGEPGVTDAHEEATSADGSSWSFMAWPIHGAAGEPSGAVIQATDVTEATLVRRRWERANEEIREMNQGLLLSSLREHELATQAATAEEQLVQARKMESIGRLAGGIAHDFNNLLTAILGYAELAEAAARSGDELEPSLEGIRHAAERAATLTGQLLAFARKQITQPKVVDLNTLIVDIDKMLRRLLRADIELSFVPASRLAMVRMDPGQFGQVLMNLVVNARDAMPDGGRIAIETTNLVLDEGAARAIGGIAPGPWTLLTVSDTGVGMTEDVQARLFEPFFTTKSFGSGTGLGLATCYGIVQQGGGQIRVISAPGAGTTVKIYLARAEPEAAPPLEPPLARSSRAAVILVVEDEPMVRDIAAQVLRRDGHVVLEAADGREALEIFRARADDIELVLTDVMMPHVGGKELADRLHATHPDLAVLYMSGHTEAAIVEDGVLAAGLSFLHKPFSPKALASKVREMLALIPARNGRRD